MTTLTISLGFNFTWSDSRRTRTRHLPLASRTLHLSGPTPKRFGLWQSVTRRAQVAAEKLKDLVTVVDIVATSVAWGIAG